MFTKRDLLHSGATAALALAANNAMPSVTQLSAGTLPQLSAGQSLGIALGIPTVPNLRDVGGYKTRDGATVVRGLAYRSDTFNPMNVQDIQRIEPIGLRKRLDDPSRHWTIGESDYSERELWPQYVEAYEEATELTSTKHAPWYVIPANHKWFRNLAVSQIIADTMDEMGLKLPPTRVDIADIRRKYHAAEGERKIGGQQQSKNAEKVR